jgi:hypothetical protein
MRIKQQLSRVIALCAATSMLAACGGGGGGGSHGFLPGSPTGTNNTAQKSNALFKVTLPSATATSSSKRPAYISSQGASSLVVSVTPADPAEAALWATTYGAAGFTVCYPIFSATNVPVTSNPAVVVTVGTPNTVSFPFPSPPGQDTFVITQYAGTCASSYAPPTPPTGVTAAQLIISQSTPLVVNLQPGVTNNFNTQLFACTVAGVNPPAGGTCAVPGLPGTLTPTLGASVSFVYLAGSNAVLPLTLPAAIPLLIAAPMREQSVFTAVPANKVGFPIPVVGLDGNGNPVPYTAPAGPGLPASSGLLPHGANNPACVPSSSVTCADKITLTLTEADVTGANHFALELVDAKTGQIAQAAGTTVTLTQLNALDAADITGAGAAGDQYVVVALFDGSPAAASTSMTVTMAATISSTAITPQVLTIKPQASLFTAVAAGPTTGYTDAGAPYTAAADILNTNLGYWVTDGGNIHLVGTGTYAVTGATTLTGMTFDNNPSFSAGFQILAVDNHQAANTGSVTPVASGVYAFNQSTQANNALAVQDATTGNYVAFGAPQAIAYVAAGYVYVAAGNKIYAIDPDVDSAGAPNLIGGTTFDSAEEIGTLSIAGLNSGTDTGFDMIASGTKLIFADTGNGRIVSVDTATCLPGGAACTATVIASGHPFVGLSANGTGYIATDTAGQIYTITSAGTVTSLGLSGGAVKDGVVGVIGTNPLAPIPYTTQGQTANFFGSASVPTLPYNIAPFTPAGPVFTVAPAGLAADTSNGTFGATAGTTKAGFGVALIPAAPASTALTANSYLFTDGGSLRTLVP